MGSRGEAPESFPDFCQFLTIWEQFENIISNNMKQAKPAHAGSKDCKPWWGRGAEPREIFLIFVNFWQSETWELFENNTQTKKGNTTWRAIGCCSVTPPICLAIALCRHVIWPRSLFLVLCALSLFYWDWVSYITSGLGREKIWRSSFDGGRVKGEISGCDFSKTAGDMSPVSPPPVPTPLAN